MHPFLNTAVKAARAAGDIMVRKLDHLHRLGIKNKGPNDYVTEVDIAVEEEIIDILKAAYPEHSILSEEAGDDDGNNEFQWIIDPIDGTANYMRGLPHFCVSIALAIHGKVEHGVIYDPVRQDLFTASRGRGAQLNDKRIRVSKAAQLSDAILASGYPYDRSEEDAAHHANILQAILPACSDLRRAGSAALDLAYVACGRLDGYWETPIKIWDVAAGSLMVKEAGGFVSDLSGGENYLEKGNIICANPKIFKAMMKTIGPVMPKEWR